MSTRLKTLRDDRIDLWWSSYFGHINRLLIADSRSKALGDKFPRVECRRSQL